jgi:D-alanyl-D-alanine carboxypeptidase
MAAAQTPVHPFTSGMADRITAIAQAEVDQGRTAGLAIGVVQDGRVVYSRGFGQANVARKLSAEPSTQFYIAHLTEQFTAGSILLLVQDGKLKLEDKVTKLVPELTVAGDTTIAQLLQQTSGLPQLSRVHSINTDPTRSIKITDLITAVNTLTPEFAPGTKVQYNDLNYFIAGLIVERASGLPLSDFFSARIFQPLFMNSSFYANDTGISPDHAIGYTGAPNALRPAPMWSPSWMLGASGLVSSVDDLAKWDIEMPVLLRVDAVRDMFTPSGAPGAQAYGMGWVVDQRDGLRYIWRNGEISGYHAMNALLPDNHVAVIVLTNTDSLHSADVISPEGLAGEILDIIVPPQNAQMDNTVVTRAQEWLQRLADRNIDRTQLTPEFSTYLTDKLVADSNIRAYGKVENMFPIASWPGAEKGSTVYEFLVRFPHRQFHYKFGLTQQGKIDELLLER